MALFPRKFERSQEILILLTWRWLLIANHKQFRGILDGRGPPVLAFRVWGLVSQEYDVLVMNVYSFHYHVMNVSIQS